MLKSFIGADMRLYERFGIGLHNNPDAEIFVVKSAEKSRLADGKGMGIKPKINPNNEN